MKKCLNQCENRAMNLITSAYEFSSDSGASEKHFIFLMFGQLFRFLDRLLDTRDDAKTQPKGPQKNRKKSALQTFWSIFKRRRGDVPKNGWNDDGGEKRMFFPKEWLKLESKTFLKKLGFFENGKWRIF